MSEVRARRRESLTSGGLYLVTDDRLREPELLQRLEAALRAGTRVVQYRAKQLDRGPLLRQAERVQACCRAFGALFIVNDAADVAALLSSDGLHLGQTDLPAHLARRLVGPDQLIGLSVSAVEEARLAAADPEIDYLGVGAIYPTDTKPDAEFGGLALLRAVRAAVRLPLVAIGGITAPRVAEVRAAGADSVAVVAAVFGAADSEQAARALLVPSTTA